MVKSRPQNASIDRICELLDYDPITGVIRWKMQRGRQRVGSVAGCVTSTGYRYISIDGQFYLAQRLAWLLISGEWPEFEVDHRDRNRDNNAKSNLRPATRIQNTHNTSLRSDNTSGHAGVSYGHGKWVARMVHEGKSSYLGRFLDKADAVEARLRVARPARGEFFS